MRIYIHPHKSNTRNAKLKYYYWFCNNWNINDPNVQGPNKDAIKQSVFKSDDLRRYNKNLPCANPAQEEPDIATISSISLTSGENVSTNIETEPLNICNY